MGGYGSDITNKIDIKNVCAQFSVIPCKTSDLISNIGIFVPLKNVFLRKDEIEY